VAPEPRFAVLVTIVDRVINIPVTDILVTIAPVKDILVILADSVTVVPAVPEEENRHIQL